jgi:hypothetical protein
MSREGRYRQRLSRFAETWQAYANLSLRQQLGLAPEQ